MRFVDEIEGQIRQTQRLIELYSYQGRTDMAQSEKRMLSHWQGLLENAAKKANPNE